MLTLSKAALFLAFFSGWALLAQASASEAQPFGFRDVYIGMSAAAFEAKHPKFGTSAALPVKAKCTQGTGQALGVHSSTPAVTRCDYQESDRDVPVRVSTMFVNGRLALIEVEPPLDTDSCFEGSPSDNFCGKYLQLLQDMVGNFGKGEPMPSAKAGVENLHAFRWESDSAVAEFQAHMCGPWDGTDAGWGKAISEILDSNYCSQSDVVSIRQPVMLYVDKQSSRILSSRLTK